MSMDGNAYTSPTTLHLATPTAIVKVLGALGIRWSPRPVRRGELEAVGNDAGLYVWVVVQPPDKNPMLAGGIYAGIGDGKGGLRGRLKNEFDGVASDLFHGHALAVNRTIATVVAGPVEWTEPRPDLNWIDRSAPGLCRWDWCPKGWDEAWDATIRRRLTERLDNVVRVSEAVAIRAAVYLGDVGFAVNSKMAGAWGMSYGPHDQGWEDGAAWAAVTHIRGDTGSLPGEPDDVVAQ